MIDFLLGVLAGIAYAIALAALILFLLLHRRPKPSEPRTLAEREFLQIVGRARR